MVYNLLAINCHLYYLVCRYTYPDLSLVYDGGEPTESIPTPQVNFEADVCPGWKISPIYISKTFSSGLRS